MKTSRVRVVVDRLTNTVIRLILLVLLTAASAKAEWISFGIKTSLTYIEEGFSESIGWTSGGFYEDAGAAAFQGLGVDSDSSAFPMTIYCGDEYATLDISTILNAAGGYAWLDFQPQPNTLPIKRVLLPWDRYNHSLALSQADANGVPFNMPLNVTSLPSLDDGNGVVTYFPKATAVWDPTRPFWVVDLTDKKKAPVGETDLRNATWVTDYAQYPLIEVALYLEEVEIGHKFTVYSWAQDGPINTLSVTATPNTDAATVTGYLPPTWTGIGAFQVGTGTAVLHFPVGNGMSFYVSRDADGINTMGYGAFLASTGNPLIWSVMGLFPDPPVRSTPMEPRNFRINAGRGGHQFTVWMSDGYSTHFDAWQYGTDYVSEWDGQYIYNVFQCLTLSASIDPSKSWWLRDDTTGEDFPIGQTDILDGWTPQFEIPLPYPTITVHLPSWGLASSVSLMEYGSSVEIFPTSNVPETTNYAGVDGMVGFTIEGAVLTFPNPDPQSYAGIFNIIGGFPSGNRAAFPGENDFRLEFSPPQTLNLNISNSRWEHELVVRHSEGTSFPIIKHASQGDISFDPNQNGWWNSYYCFDANSVNHPGIPWYVEDRTTNQRIGPYPSADDLINWIYLSPPVFMDAYAPSSSSIQVAWGPVVGAAQYLLERRRPFGDGSASQWSLLATISSPVIQYLDFAASVGTIYAYRVIAVSGTHQSLPSEEVWAALPQPVPPDPNPDSDGNGIPDSEEVSGDIDGDTVDNAHDSDNDNDGIADYEDEWPDDPRRSESIPPAFYGIIDLGAQTYGGSPAPTAGFSTMAIDNDDRVAWINFTNSDVYGVPVQEVVKWQNGAIQNVTTYGYNAATNPQSWDQTIVAGINGAGQFAGVHHHSQGSSASYTIRAMPGDRAVASPYLHFQEDNSDFTDSGFQIGFQNSLITNEDVRFGVIQYVTGSAGGNGQPDTRQQLAQRVRYKHDDGQIAEGPNEGTIAAVSDNGAAVLTNPAPTILVNGIPNMASEIGSAILWKHTTGLVPLGLVKPYAVNNQEWVVGSKMYWETDPDSGSQLTRNYEGPEPTASDPLASYGRGELGFVWTPTDGMRTFHDLLPVKYRKMIRNAVPFMMTNADPATGKPRIFFSASVAISAEPNVWKNLTLILEWEDPDGAGPLPAEPLLRYVSLGEKLNSATNTYSEVSATFLSCNDQSKVIGVYNGSPSLFGPIEILDNQKNRNPLNDLVISKWEEAFELVPGSGPALKADFISDLHDSFHIRYPFSPPSPQTAPRAWFGVKRPPSSGIGPSAVVDAQTEIQVTRESSNAGIAVTQKSHILVASERDDTDPLMNTKGTAADEQIGDRTHFAALRDVGELVIEQPHGIYHYDIPISHKKRMKTLPLKIYLVRKSPGGPLCASQAWLEQFLQETTKRLAQVNILPVVQSVEEIDPPEGLDLSRGLCTHIGEESVTQSSIFPDGFDTERLIEGRASRSEDDVEIYVVNYFSLFRRKTGEFQPFPWYGFAHQDSDYMSASPAPLRLRKFGDPETPGSGLKWKRGTMVVGAEAASGVVPQLGDRGVFSSVGGHEITHIIGSLDHRPKADPLRTVNLLYDRLDDVQPWPNDHPFGTLRLDRGQENLMRQHRALK